MLQRVFEFTYRTFHLQSNHFKMSAYRDKIFHLASLVERLRPEDFWLQFQLQLIKKSKNYNGATVLFLKIFSHQTFEMGIFYLPKQSRIPLHDHPNMCVVSKLLLGSVHWKAFDCLSKTSFRSFLCVLHIFCTLTL
jgi:hypothetical protein